MITLEQGEVRRGAQRVLEAVTLSLPDRGTVGIVGMNGAGKSTLFHALADVLPRRSGSARVRGTDGAIGYAPQQPTFPEWLTVDGVARLYGQGEAALTTRFPGLLLDEITGRSAGALSVGQRQVLSVALALALDANLTLLDEPFAPLDFRRRIGLVRTLAERRRGPGLTMVSSQAAADLLDTCDWLLVMYAGRYVYNGALATLSGGDTGEASRRQLEESIMALMSGHAEGAPAGTADAAPAGGARAPGTC